MGTKGFKIFFREDEEDYLDNPITLFDFEQHTVFCSSKEFLRNITIEDPGYVVSISEEDYEVQLQKSLLQVKELRRVSERNGKLLRKCRSCSIKVIDCHKFPWYHQNKLGVTKKTQYLDREHNIEGNDKAEITIIDLTENERALYNNQYDNGIPEEYTNNKEKEANCNEFTSVGNANERAIQKLKNSIESSENSKNISHYLGNKLLFGNKSDIKKWDNLLKDAKKIEKEAKVSKDRNNNDYDDVHDKKKHNKCNKIKNIYTSEQISKTKIKIKKYSLKSKAMVSIQNYYKEIKDKGLNPNAINREKYDSLKNIENIHNATNQNQQNHCENKQERVQCNSYLYPTLSSLLLPNQNIDPDRFHGCNKPLITADRIIPHFHENGFVNYPDVLSKVKSNTTCSKESIHIYEIKKNKTAFDSTDKLNIGSMVSQMPLNNNTMVNNNESHNKNYNTKADISNISTIHSVTPSQVTYKLSYKNGILLERSTHASPDLIKENINNFMRHGKEIAAQLEGERVQYLLPSNLSDLHIQNLF